MKRFPGSFRKSFLPSQTVSYFQHLDSRNDLRKLFLNRRSRCGAHLFPLLETAFASGNCEFPGSFLKRVFARRTKA